MASELKARDMTDSQKIEFISSVQQHKDFCGIGITFDKYLMYKDIESENIFFNYGVKILLDDVVFNLVGMSEEVHFSIFCDNRNLRVGDLKDLEQYLNTEFCLENCTFSVSYGDSAGDYRLQLADLVVNTIYLRKKNRAAIIDVLRIMDRDHFSLTQFPGKKLFGRCDNLW